MKCIVGLGNPGKKYDKTRHNIGFMVIDELLRQNHWTLNKSKFKGLMATEHISGEKVIFLKPQTFMNLSGESVRPLLDFYNIEAKDLLVIYDDLDLPVGKIRLRQKGSHGGHNGIRSIINHVGTKEFKRIRVGVGRPTSSIPIVDYVLSTFPKADKPTVEESIAKAVDACMDWTDEPFEMVMNTFNQK